MVLDICFSGDDAKEYMRICNHEYDDDPRRGSLSKFLSDHMIYSHNPETGTAIIESDLMNFELS